MPANEPDRGLRLRAGSTQAVTAILTCRMTDNIDSVRFISCPVSYFNT